MESSIQDFLTGMQTPTKKLTITELREREAIWRTLWGWIPDEVKYYVLRVGSTIRVVKRDYKGSLGELGKVDFKLDEIELVVYEKSYNPMDGKYYYEKKVCKIPAGTIMMQEFILDSAPADEVEQPEVMPVEEADSEVPSLQG